MEKCKLPSEAKHLAWLDLHKEVGMEYWMAMNLAGDYSSANHHDIHRRLSKGMKEKPLVMLENHHNFAWKEKLEDGTEAIVHRKGATPAFKGAIGIIPGSMATPGFIVRGKGNAASLNSASHGAGRAMSRNKAKQTFTAKEVKQFLEKNGIELIGGGTDEAPLAYKDIHKVMEHQKDLIEIIGVFHPKIVRMDG
jgi:tRNA-splicing ligase RtcB